MIENSYFLFQQFETTDVRKYLIVTTFELMPCEIVALNLWM